jgi:hypothetical protein
MSNAFDRPVPTLAQQTQYMVDAANETARLEALGLLRGTCGYCGSEVTCLRTTQWKTDAEADAWACPTSPRGRHDPDVSQCVLCLRTGPSGEFEDVNGQGNRACRAIAACEVRQSSENAAHYLGTLLRAVRIELGSLTVDELANLSADLDGYAGAVNIQLSCHADSGAALERVRTDRAKRKARKLARINLDTGRPI